MNHDASGKHVLAKSSEGNQNKLCKAAVAGQDYTLAHSLTRKTWTTIIGKRINQIWHRIGLINRQQYGYQLDNGVQMALFNTINQIEGAHHRQATKYITFWDIRRAFDSIPRTLQRLAWRRLGIPPDIADWFVDLDTNGSSFIATPLYDNKHCTSTSNTIHHTDVQHLVSLSDNDAAQSNLAFHTQRGIGQGESASSLMWTALYDILLEWIDPANRELHSAESDLHYTAEDISEAQMNAYADDLCTITGGPNAAHLQSTQAKWLSAFCAFTGLTMHPAKIIPTIVGKIPLHYRKAITVYDHQWNPTACSVLPHLESYKYLGVHLDLRNRPKKSFQKVLDNATTRLSHLLRQPASPTIKLDYIRFKILPIILYTALCSSWTLAQYRDLDTPFNQTYKKILCLPTKLPTALLYLPTTLGGIGLPRASDKAQLMKWESFQRCSAVHGDPAHAVTAFLNRIPTLPSTLPVNPHLRTIPCPTTPDSWPPTALTARSLVQWAHESKILLTCRTGTTTEEDIIAADNDNTITDLAFELDLWPDPRRSNDLCDCILLRLFATDGSYKAEPTNLRDIITPEKTLRDKGKGAGGIVFLQHRTTAPTLGVRITSDKPEPGMNALASHGNFSPKL